jgi:alpha-N-arabinofuranosidase
VPYLECIATCNRESGEATVFAVNRSMTDELLFQGSIRGWDHVELVEHIALAHEDPKATNTKEKPCTVVPRRLTSSRVEGDTLQAALPPLSWNVIRLNVRHK